MRVSPILVSIVTAMAVASCSGDEPADETDPAPTPMATLGESPTEAPVAGPTLNALQEVDLRLACDRIAISVYAAQDGDYARATESIDAALENLQKIQPGTPESTGLAFEASAVKLPLLRNRTADFEGLISAYRETCVPRGFEPIE